MELGKLACTTSWTFGMILDDIDVEKQAVAAARQYLGWGTIASIDGVPVYSNPTEDLFNPQHIPYLGRNDFPGVIVAGYVEQSMMPRPTPPVPPTPAPLPALSAKTDIGASEWAVIKPLFMLYAERENARALEASRNLGVEVYGRSISEIQPDIERYENEILPRAAFSQSIETL